jgi:hypothetical protein
MGMDDDAQIFSVIGGAKRSGRWRVPASTRTLTLFGRCLIDLRQAETTADELSFSCISVFAGVTFIVPEGAEVRPSGMAILGSARSLVPVSDSPATLPPISIDAITVLGRLRIRTTDEEPEEELRDSWRERRRERKAAKRAGKPGTSAKDAQTAEPARAAASTATFDDDRFDTDGRAERDVRIRREAERELVDEGDLRRSARPERELVDEGDLRRSARRDEEPELVDLEPVIRRPSISSPTTVSDDDGRRDEHAEEAAAPDLFGPRASTQTVDPEPVGSIDDHPPRRNAGPSSGRSSTTRSSPRPVHRVRGLRDRLPPRRHRLQARARPLQAVPSRGRARRRQLHPRREGLHLAAPAPAPASAAGSPRPTSTCSAGP